MDRARPAHPGGRPWPGLQRALLRRVPRPGRAGRGRAGRQERDRLWPGHPRYAWDPPVRGGPSFGHPARVSGDAQPGPHEPAAPAVATVERPDRPLAAAFARSRDHPAEHARAVRRRPDRRALGRHDHRASARAFPDAARLVGLNRARDSRRSGAASPASPMAGSAGSAGSWSSPRSTISSRPPAPPSSASPTPAVPRPRRWASSPTRARGKT